MADCGAAGTTLDRAARAVLGPSTMGQSSAASKHLGSFLGHASVGMVQQQQLRAMPMSAPDRLVLPGGTSPGLKSPPPASAVSAPLSMGHNYPQQQHPPSSMDAVWSTPISKVIMHHPALQNPHQAAMVHQQQQFQQYRQQQSMHAMMHHQQQQLTMMVQQQHYQQQAMQLAQKEREIQQQQQKILQSQPAADKLGDVSGLQNGDALEHWHDRLEADAAHELQQLYDQDDVATVGHEGFVQGASIEELSAAWAQAEAEYDELASNSQRLASQDYLNDDLSNLWSGDMTSVHQAPYEFVNQQMESPSELFDWMAEGIKHFQVGDLKEAIRAFEMELQHKNPDNSVAWRMLGRCHAENDQDSEAIKCLEAAVDRDPYSPEALLALGVSYVNELNHEKALENLKAWFTHNPKYAGMDLSPLEQDIYGASGSTARESVFEEVKRLLQSALDIDAADAGDIHEALGVIYNVSKDYEAAVSSFLQALETRPNDYQLWNKLGATYANSNQSERALPAYHRALQIKPKYARAWLNMAISHSNLQNHEEAARCYLQTLSLNPAAKHCWSYLRMALSCSEKWDMLPLCFSQELKPFQAHYDFVSYD
jgi:peroxin-5